MSAFVDLEGHHRFTCVRWCPALSNYVSVIITGTQSTAGELDIREKHSDKCSQPRWCNIKGNYCVKVLIIPGSIHLLLTLSLRVGYKQFVVRVLWISVFVLLSQSPLCMSTFPAAFSAWLLHTFQNDYKTPQLPLPRSFLLFHLCWRTTPHDCDEDIRPLQSYSTNAVLPYKRATKQRMIVNGFAAGYFFK